MAKTVAEDRTGPTLSEAMSTVFRPKRNDEDFSSALTNLAVALTTARAAHVLRQGERSPIASSPREAELPEDSRAWALDYLAGNPTVADPVEQDGALAVTLALPAGKTGVLVIRLRNPAPSVRALAFERLVALSHLSFSTFRHADVQGFENLLRDIRTGQSPEDVASHIRAFADADNVALAWLKGDAISHLTLSNQPAGTPRASLPETLEAELKSARDPSRRGDHVHVALQGEDAIAMKVDRPRRHLHILPLLPQAMMAANGPGVGPGRGSRKKWLRRAVFLLLAIGVALIPIPDARRVPGEVISTDTRTITAPLSGVVLSVDVSDGDAVQAGDSTLFRLDTDDVLQELAGAQADYSRALLERESARGARDAAALQNAELEAESLRARIDLLENRRVRATVTAPIDGVVSGEDLSRFAGATVRLGDPILEVLNPDILALRLEVPDILLNRIENGEAGVFRPDFAPDQSFASTVSWISPAQSTRTDVVVFPGRAILPDNTAGLRPGLRGVFVFEREFKPIYKVVWKALSDWVLLRLWL